MPTAKTAVRMGSGGLQWCHEAPVLETMWTVLLGTTVNVLKKFVCFGQLCFFSFISFCLFAVFSPFFLSVCLCCCFAWHTSKLRVRSAQQGTAQTYCSSCKTWVSLEGGSVVFSLSSVNFPVSPYPLSLQCCSLTLPCWSVVMYSTVQVRVTECSMCFQKEQEKLLWHNQHVLSYAKQQGMDVVDTFNITMARYSHFLQGRCACHFHRVSVCVCTLVVVFCKLWSDRYFNLHRADVPAIDTKWVHPYAVTYSCGDQRDT